MKVRFLSFIILFSLSIGNISAQNKQVTDSLKAELYKLSTDSDKVKTLFRISKSYWHSNPDSAQSYANRGLQLARSIHCQRGEADCLNSLSAVYWMHRNYPMALDYTLQNLSIRQEIGDTTGIFNASNNLGLIYYETRKYDLALRYCKEAFAMANKMKDQKKLAKALANLGMVYFELKDTTKAYASYKKALDIESLLKDSLEMSYLYYNIGELMYSKSPAEAIAYYKKSLSIAERQGNKELISACSQILADQLLKQGKPDESIVLAKKALKVASEIKHLRVINHAAHTLYEAYLQKKDYREGLKYHIVAEEAKDSMMNEKKMSEMSDLRYGFDMKQKEKQIELLERDKIIAQKNAQAQKLIFFVEMLAIVLAGVVLFGVYRNYRIRQQKRERIRYEKMLIAAKEKAEENDRLKTAFLCNMSHEIRTPMNAIIGFTDLMVYRDVPPEKQKRYLKLIKERTVDLLHIIEDILDISKIEVGQVKLSESNTDLEGLMTGLLEFYRLKITSAHKSNLEIDFKLDKDLVGIKILVDAQRLKQILGNLLDNALKFTGEGLIEYGCHVKEDHKLLFYVKDSGIGIPKDKQELIFDRFRQVDEEYHIKHYGGTGLGLSIVKGLLSFMEGEIWVESNLGHGSVFYFTIPFKKS